MQGVCTVTYPRQWFWGFKPPPSAFFLMLFNINVIMIYIFTRMSVFSVFKHQMRIVCKYTAPQYICQLSIALMRQIIPQTEISCALIFYLRCDLYSGVSYILCFSYCRYKIMFYCIYHYLVYSLATSMIAFIHNCFTYIPIFIHIYIIIFLCPLFFHRRLGYFFLMNIRKSRCVVISYILALTQ